MTWKLYFCLVLILVAFNLLACTCGLYLLTYTVALAFGTFYTLTFAHLSLEGRRCRSQKWLASSLGLGRAVYWYFVKILYAVHCSATTGFAGLMRRRPAGIFCVLYFSARMTAKAAAAGGGVDGQAGSPLLSASYSGEDGSVLYVYGHQRTTAHMVLQRHYATIACTLLRNAGYCSS